MQNKKTALITGAAGGIGAVTAETLAAEGYNIVICDVIDEDSAAVAVQSCEKHGAEVLYIRADVSSYSECGEVIKQAITKFGQIYALINNAGINRDALIMRMTEEQYDLVLNVNLKSAFNMCKFVMPHMIKAKEGRIVNISSVVGLYGNAGQVNYAASKAGLIGLTKTLAKEVGSRGITVNAIAPGYIQSKMTDALPDSSKSELTSRIALRKLGTTQDVANAVSFLVSGKASYITATTLSVDGGMVI